MLAAASLMLLPLVLPTQASSLDHGVLAKTLRGLEWKQVDFLLPTLMERQIVMHLALERTMPFRSSYLADREWTNRKGQTYIPLVVVAGNIGDLSSFKDVLDQGDFVSERIMLLWNHKSGLAKLEATLEEMNLSRAFYYFGWDSTSDLVLRIQTFRNSTRLLKNEFYKDSVNGYYSRQYDFQGAPFTILGMNYPPWLILKPCPNRPHQACSFTGEAFVQPVAYMFNFTLELFIQEDGNWGTLPVIGESGEEKYVGVFGAIVDDKYDKAALSWIMTEERVELVGFSVVTIQLRMAYFMDINRGTVLDWTLYLRPFTYDAWAACFLLTLFVSIAYIAGQGFMSRSDGKILMVEALKILAFSGWLCFVFVKTYYDGALTMFFTTKDPVPFNTLEDGLSLYPRYRLLIKRGNEAFLRQGALGGSVEMQKHLKRIAKDKDLVPDSWSAVLEGLKKPGAFTEALPSEIKFYMNYLEIEDLDLKIIFDSPSSSKMANIYPKRSPWKEAINEGIRSILASGIIARVGVNEEYKAPSDSASATEVLDLSQVGLTFLLWGTISSLALVILIFEVSAVRIGQSHFAVM